MQSPKESTKMPEPDKVDRAVPATSKPLLSKSASLKPFRGASYDSDDAEERSEQDKEHQELLNNLVRVFQMSKSVANDIVDRLSCIGPAVDLIDTTIPPPSEAGYEIEGLQKKFTQTEVEVLQARRKLLLSQLSNGGRGNFNTTWQSTAFLRELSDNRIKDYQMAGVHWLHTIHDTYIDRTTKKVIPCVKGWESGPSRPLPDTEEELWPKKNSAGINAILADEMGLGKTAQTILFLFSLYHTGRLKKPTIVCCPASLMDNWINELALWAPSLRCMKWHGTRNEKLALLSEWSEAKQKHDANEVHFFSDERILGYDDEDAMQAENLDEIHEEDRWIKESCHYLPSIKYPDNFKRCTQLEWSGRTLIGYDVIVTSHDAVRSTWDRTMFFKKAEFSYMVVDEAHALKNSASQTYKALLTTIRAERRLLLTGSPVQNALNELLTLIAFLVPTELMPRESWESAMTLLANMHKNELALIAARKKNDVAKIKELKDVYRVQLPKILRQSIEAKIAEQESESVRQLQLKTDADAAIVADQGDSPSTCDSATTKKALATNDPDGTPSEYDASHNQNYAQFDTLYGALKTKKSGQTKGLRWDVIYLQTVLTPIILRRLKEETIKDLPPKMNQIRPCKMTPSQENAYVSEIKKASSSMGVVLRKLDSLRTGKKMPKAEAKKKEIKDELDGQSSATSGATTGKVTSGAPKEDFVKNLVARLRRITNHSLLNVGRHSEAQYDAAKLYWTVNYSGKEANNPQAMDWVNKFSDFDWHMFASEFEDCPKELAPMKLSNDAFSDSGKMIAFLDELDRCARLGKKCLAFSQFVQYLDIVQETLHKHRPDIKFLRIDGQTNAKLRQGLVDQFNADPEITVILLSTRAAGQGYNLTAADTVLLLDQDWNPQVDRQAEDRVHRLGQTKPVTVIRFFCEGTIEEKILHTCQSKLDLDDAFGGNSELLSAALLEDALQSLPQVELKTEAEKAEDDQKVASPSGKGNRKRRKLAPGATDDAPEASTPPSGPTNRKRISTATNGDAADGPVDGSGKATSPLVKRRIKVRRVKKKINWRRQDGRCTASKC